MSRVPSIIAALLFTTACSKALPSRAQGRPIPPAARQAGYLTETFGTDRFDSRVVDQAQTFRPGFSWYHWNFFGSPVAASATRLANDGTASVSRGYANGNLVTAARTNDGAGWHGLAFGGGFYAEAELAFEATKVDVAQGWPAWWSIALEHLIEDGSSQWPGEVRGYEHFAELDFMEYLHGRNDPDAYGATFHDWHGQWNKTCPNFCQRTAPDNDAKARAPRDFDWHQFHRYGARVIPASTTSLGQITFYLDDKQVGQTISYRPFSPRSRSAVGWTQTAGIIDQQHMVLVLGAGSTPMRVRSVHVWQRSAAGNLIR